MTDLPTLPSFQNQALLHQALTHRSYANEHPNSSEDNERLEFLGDAVLNFLSGEFLYKRYPEKPEGELTALRSALVDETQLAKFADRLGIGQHMRLGKGASREGGQQNPHLLSCAFEAVIGAYFLDTNSDIDAVRRYVIPLFEQAVDQLIDALAAVNFKSCFQEWALANFKQNPKYRIVSQSGPDHAKEFTAEVWIGNQKYGQGQGRKKQEAEKDAAKVALQALGLL